MSKTKVIFWKQWFLRMPYMLVFVHGFVAVMAQGQDFHVKGEVEYRYYSEVFAREFEFFVKGNAWQLVVSRNLPDIVFPGPRTLLNGRVIEPPNVPGRKPGDKIAEEVRDFFVMGGDSLEEHYYFERRSAYYTESIAPALPGAPPPPVRPAGKRSQEMVRIYPGPVPWESREKCLPYLWLAFGSRPYFENLKASKGMPFYNQWAQRWGGSGLSAGGTLATGGFGSAVAEGGELPEPGRGVDPQD